MEDNRNLRVLMLTSETSWRGGETQVELLIRGMAAGGHEVALAAPAGSGIAGRTAAEVRQVPLNIAGGLDIAASWRLRRLLSRDGYDVVHAHSSHAHSVAFLATSGWRRRPRLVVSRRVAFPVSGNPLSRIKYARGADRYIAISEAVKDSLVAGGVSPSLIDVIPSGVDLSKFDSITGGSALRTELSIPEGVPVIGSIGALVPNKAHDDFIRAAKTVHENFPDAYFLIVGEGPQRSCLEGLAEMLRLRERVRLTGFRTDALDLLAMCDCFVISSILEGLCTSVMDAQVAGIPVVATATGGIPELVTGGESGLLVPPRSPDRLAEAIIRILSDPGLRSRCIAGGRAKSGAYDYRLMVERTEACYRMLLGR